MDAILETTEGMLDTPTTPPVSPWILTPPPTWRPLPAAHPPPGAGPLLPREDQGGGCSPPLPRLTPLLADLQTSQAIFLHSSSY